MTDRHFRLLLGLALLLLLYLDRFNGVGVVIGLLIFEGLTNWRLPRLTGRMFCGTNGASGGVQLLGNAASAPLRIPFEAERALRLVIALILLLSLFVFPEHAWWMAWFVAFALLGAGLSGVCPMLTSLRLLGFK